MYKKNVLENGLTIITAPMKQVESLTLMIIAKVGARYETKRVNGIAHFAEHMFFKGTKKRPKAVDISSEIDGIGGVFNAGTGNELTRFFVKCASKHLDLAFDVLSDMVTNSKFEEEEIEREKGVIIEEMNMYYDDPKWYLGEVWQKLLYGDHPLGWDVLGTKEVIKAIKRQDFLDYVKSWYPPSNLVLIVAGSFDEKRMTAAVRSHFGSFGKGSVGKCVSVKESQTQSGLRLHFKKTDQAHLALGVRTFPRTHPDRYKAQVLNTILGKGMSSRLFVEVRERRGLCYYIRSDRDAYVDAGSLGAVAGVDLKRVDDAVKVILEVFYGLVEKPVSDKELSKAKEMTKGRMILALEDTRAVASFLGSQEALEGKIRTMDIIISEVEAVTAEDVQQLAKRIFVNGGLNLAMIGPFKDEERFRKILKF